MNLLKKLKSLIFKDEKGSLMPYQFRNATPMTPQQEASLRGLCYECANVKILLNELDRRDEIVKKSDHDLWLTINKSRRKSGWSI